MSGHESNCRKNVYFCNVMASNAKYAIGVDIGTDSARAVLVEVSGSQPGKELSVHTSEYKRWKKGLYSDASESRFRQHPDDYKEAVEEVLKKVVRDCPEPDNILSIAVDTTGSTPCLVDEDLTPLCFKEGYEENPDAMFVLWKDHTGERESMEINSVLSKFSVNYAVHCGGTYGPENFWSKILHILRNSPSLFSDAYAAIELCDYVPAFLTGCHSVRDLKMSRAVAGAKWMWAEEWGGYPPEAFFKALDPALLPFLRNLPRKNYYCSEVAGHLSKEWAERLGLGENVLVGVGNIDSYSGAVGAGVAYGRMVMNLGTSACYMSVVPNDIMNGRVVEGVFGQVDGMLLKGYNGFEVGLSAYGDAFAWLKRVLSWPLEEFLPEKERESIEEKMLIRLGEEAEKLPQRVEAPIATDHFNGRRCPFINSSLTATISGLKLSTTAPELYYAIVEATAFATRAILEHMAKNDVRIDSLVAVGGVSQKSSFAIQMLADVTGYRIEVSAGKNAGALGAVINSTVFTGIFPDVPSAQKAFCPPVLKTYEPDISKKEFFDIRYARYKEIVSFNEKRTRH